MNDLPAAAPLELFGRRVAVIGKLASMSWREAQSLLKSAGAIPVDKLDDQAHVAVVGEAEAFESLVSAAEQVADETILAAIRDARLTLVWETQLWQRLGLVEAPRQIQRLYTPAMLAELASVPLPVIRRWHRRGLIVPVREVRRLPYFDFQEVTAARRLAGLLAAGISPATLERKLAALAPWLPDVERPLAQLSVIVQGRQILLKRDGGLIGPGGQMRFDFGLAENEMGAIAAAPAVGENFKLSDLARAGELGSLRAEVARLEEAGLLAQAAVGLRVLLAAEGPSSELCFQLAEILYRLDDRAAARERYYMAIELDEEFVEARANLGCVLAELGELSLAVAAFEGALSLHAEYADVHFHLARALDELGEPVRAAEHWREFLRLAPDSPWAPTAQTRLS